MQATVKRFHYWELNGKGQINGRFPLAEGVKPDNYSELHYDAQGTLVQIREILEGTASPIVRVLHFDAKGRLEHSDRDGPEPTIKQRNSYKYGPDGLLCSRQESNRDTQAVVFETRSKCDKKGNIIEDKRHDAKGAVELWSQYEYNDKGYKTKETKRDANNVLGHFCFFHDAEGHEIRREWHSADGKEQVSFVTKYGPNDLPIEATFQPAGKDSLTAVMTYDASGKRTSRQTVDHHGKRLQEVRQLPGQPAWAKSDAPVPAPMPKGCGSLTSEKPLPSDDLAHAMVSAAYGYFEQRNYIEALPLFQMAAQKYPSDAYFPYGAATCSLKLHRFEAAVIYYRQALAIDPKHQGCKEGLELCAQAMPYAAK